MHSRDRSLGTSCRGSAGGYTLQRPSATREPRRTCPEWNQQSNEVSGKTTILPDRVGFMRRLMPPSNLQTDNEFRLPASGGSARKRRESFGLRRGDETASPRAP